MLIVRILFAGHSPHLPTGYGRVVRELARAIMAAGHGLTILGMGAGGEQDRPYRVRPWVGDGIGPAHGEAAPAGGVDLAGAIEAERPDVLITLGDPWMLSGVPEIVRHTGTKWLAYFPVDGRPLPRAWAAWTAAADRAVVFSRFAQTVVQAGAGITPAIVPHGVDPQVFLPMDKATAKAKVGVGGRFVVGTVAANHLRKNLPALLAAFATFAKDKPDALLYLHTPVRGYWDLEELAQHYGIESQTRATIGLQPLSGVSDDVLATVYNSFDVFVLPSMAEGFGLPIIEAQACAVPALVTDYSASPELVTDPLCRVKVKDHLILARNIEQALIDEDDLAAKLDQLYHDRTRLAELGQAGLELTRQYHWVAVGKRFVECVESMG